MSAVLWRPTVHHPAVEEDKITRLRVDRDDVWIGARDKIVVREVTCGSPLMRFCPYVEASPGSWPVVLQVDDALDVPELRVIQMTPVGYELRRESIVDMPF